MSRRPAAGLLPVGVLATAWLVGSTALAVLGLGLCLAVVLAHAWAWLVERTLTVARTPLAAAPIEGEPLELEASIHGRRWLAARVEWRDRIGSIGERATRVSRTGRARLELPRIPRGRYPIGPGLLLVDDPLGLRRLELEAPADAAVLVRPRVPELETLFTDTGAWNDGGLRARVRRASGLEPHGVREYVEGEPLRAVHWPTSARRGELMVRELEDAPRDSVAVVVDVDAARHVGPPGDSSLDDAVRAAAGLVRAYAGRSRRALLVVGAPVPLLVRVHSLGREWEEALDALAGVEAATGTPFARLLGPRAAAGAAPELVVVTPRPEAAADALVARTASGRSSALVFVDAPTYAGRPPSSSSAALLRLAGAGVGVAVVRRGGSLVEALGALRRRAAVG